MNSTKFLNTLKDLETAFSKLSPELEITVCDNELGIEGYVVVSNTFASIGGPLGRVGKGGTRVTPTVSLEEIRMLAGIMTLKNAAANLPLGGAKSGLKADPNSPDFEKKFRRFVSLVKPVLVENGGIWGGFGFDIGMKTQQLIWACETANSLRCSTGKPIEMGGTDYDKEGIAGLGVAVAAATTLTIRKEKINQTRFAVQGLGAMGAAVVKYFSEYGASLSAISDPLIDGAFRFNQRPSDSLIECFATQNFEQAKTLLKKEAEKLPAIDSVLFEKCDILFPAARQDVIDNSNVEKIQSRYLVEAANNPCIENSRDILNSRGILVIPDFIANPGGIVAAYVEMSSSISAEENARTKAKVLEAKRYTKVKIEENTTKLLDLIEEHKVSPFQAGRYLALSAIFKNVPGFVART